MLLRLWMEFSGKKTRRVKSETFFDVPGYKRIDAVVHRVKTISKLFTFNFKKVNILQFLK